MGELAAKMNMRVSDISFFELTNDAEKCLTPLNCADFANALKCNPADIFAQENVIEEEHTMRATQKFEIDTAHRLMKHGGKCKTLHGHRYVIELTVSASALDDQGMVMDFGDIKQICGDWLNTHLDHACVLEKGDELINALVPLAQRVTVIDHAPSAEYLAFYLYGVFWGLLAPHPSVTVRSVIVRETPNCWSEYSPRAD